MFIATARPKHRAPSERNVSGMCRAINIVLLTEQRTAFDSKQSSLC